jgi:hypothetical protein
MHGRRRPSPRVESFERGAVQLACSRRDARLLTCERRQLAWTDNVDAWGKGSALPRRQTCLHELGHGLRLTHTDRYEDIMYFFGDGGDIPGYFMRSRRTLERSTTYRHRSTRVCRWPTSRPCGGSTTARKRRNPQEGTAHVFGE